MVVARSRNPILPVQAFESQVMALDAAMLVAVASPQVGAVHKLRTCTRRVQAAMELLDALASGTKPLQLPVRADETAAVRKRLRVVRQAAGAVRDLDVQCDAIQMDAPPKAEVHRGPAGDSVRKQAKQLRKHLAAQRDREADELTRVLEHEEEKVALRLRALEKVLKPAVGRAVTQAVLVDGIERWFAKTVGTILRARPKRGESLQDARQRGIHALSEDRLHAVRKAAKLCRYMAESVPEGASVRALSERFEAIQKVGGTWHDWLLLEQLSAGFHGGQAALTKRYGKHCEAALEKYHMKLVEVLPKLLQ